jgi:hypothetical protein
VITRYDEFLCHQTVSTFDRVVTSAREWTERIWYSVHDIEGRYHLIAGFGMYPNRNIMDAFACFMVEGKTQYCVRTSRELRPGIDEVRVGPLSYEVIEPLSRVRFTLGDNDFGLTCRIDFHAAIHPHEEDTQFAESRGRVLENIKRYVQVGRPKGWIKAEGAEYEVDEKTWRAERDHSWGIRRGGGVPETGVQPGEVPEGYLYNFMLAQFDSWGATYHIREDGDSKILSFSGAVMHPSGSGKSEQRITRVDHDYTFKKERRHINGGRVTLHPENGKAVTLSVRPLSTCYIRAGGYFGFRGFTHGLWLGPYYIDGFKLDLTDPGVIQEVSFLEDFMCEFGCGDEKGYGVVEMVVIGKYPRYGYQSY